MTADSWPSRWVRVLVVEDHVLVRKGVCALLHNIPNILISAETGNGEEGLRLFEEHQIDLVLMDMTLPGISGMEATAKILEKVPTARILFLSMHDNQEYAKQSLRIGARGYVPKGADFKDLREAIETVMEGGIYLPKEIARPLEGHLLQSTPGFSKGPELLTPRQRVVLKLITQGKGTREIAETLQVSVKTVETHRAHLMDRLDIHSVAGLVRFAIRKRLISLQDE